MNARINPAERKRFQLEQGTSDDDTGTKPSTPLAGRAYMNAKNVQSAEPGSQPATEDAALLRLAIPGNAKYLGVARKALARVAEQLEMDVIAEADLLLAFGEACSNAVLYGTQAHGGQLSVTCRLRHEIDDHAGPALEVDVKNPGNGFHPDIDSPAFNMPPAENLENHGRGLPLMRLLTDRVDIFAEDGDTVVRLTKRIA